MCWRLLAPFAFLFILHQIAQRTGWSLAWADSWLDDLLCLPLSLAIVLLVHRLRGRGDRFVLPVFQVVGAWLFFVLVFEIVLPRLAVVYTGDPWDGAAYAAGGLLFQVLINRPGECPV